MKKKNYSSRLSNISEFKNNELSNLMIESDRYQVFDNLLPKDFKLNEYIDINSDLQHLSYIKAKLHYITNGVKENRTYNLDDIISQSKQSIEYINFNESLMRFNLTDYEINLLFYRYCYNNGNLLQTILPKKFTISDYSVLNPDLSKFSKFTLIDHYLRCGKKEDRYYDITQLLPEDFIPSEYRDLNIDIYRKNDTKIKEHYVLYGIKENRIYKLDQIIPDNFSYETYLKSNREIIIYNLSEYEAKVYYYYFHIRNDLLSLPYSVDKQVDNMYLPTDFNIEDYRDLNPDLFSFNKPLLIRHYKLSGKNENRLYNIENNLPDDFNIDNYVYYNSNYDLINLNERQLKIHYITKGSKENRKYKSLSGKEKKYNQYPFLFSQYLLNLTNENENEIYLPEIYIYNNSYTCNKKYWCHIHISNIDDLNRYFGVCIETILKTFNLIITFAYGNKIENIDGIFIKVENIENDLQGKILVVDYLKKNNIDSEYILFINNCEDLFAEDQYYVSLISNIDIFLQKIDQNILGFFPNMIVDEDVYLLDSEKEILPKDNTDENILLNEICDYFNLDKSINIFVEGNNYILHKNIYLNLFKLDWYHFLNSKRNFDPNFIRMSNNLSTRKITELYDHFKESKNKPLSNNLKNTGLKINDCFERIIFKIVSQFDGKIHIFPNSNELNNKLDKLILKINNYLNFCLHSYNKAQTIYKNNNNSILIGDKYEGLYQTHLTDCSKEYKKIHVVKSCPEFKNM